MHGYVCMYDCAYSCTHGWMCGYVCMYVCVYVCMPMSVYIYTYIYTCMHAHIHTHTCTYTFVSAQMIRLLFPACLTLVSMNRLITGDILGSNPYFYMNTLKINTLTRNKLPLQLLQKKMILMFFQL